MLIYADIPRLMPRSHYPLNFTMQFLSLMCAHFLDDSELMPLLAHQHKELKRDFLHFQIGLHPWEISNQEKIFEIHKKFPPSPMLGKTQGHKKKKEKVALYKKEA